MLPIRIQQAVRSCLTSCGTSLFLNVVWCPFTHLMTVIAECFVCMWVRQEVTYEYICIPAHWVWNRENRAIIRKPVSYHTADPPCWWSNQSKPTRKSYNPIYAFDLSIHKQNSCSGTWVYSVWLCSATITVLVVQGNLLHLHLTKQMHKSRSAAVVVNRSGQLQHFLILHVPTAPPPQLPPPSFIFSSLLYLTLCDNLESVKGSKRIRGCFYGQVATQE